MRWRARPAERRGSARLADEKFDCVLVDLLMPEMDGIEVCRRITAMLQSLNSARPSSYSPAARTRGN